MHKSLQEVEILEPGHFQARPQEHSHESSYVKMKRSKVSPKKHELTFVFTNPDQGGSK